MARLMEIQSFYAFEYEGQDYDCGSVLGYLDAVLGHAVNHAEIGSEAKALIARLASEMKPG